MLGLELVGDVLEEASEVNVVLLVDRPAEGGQSRQPDRDGGPVRLGSIPVGFTFSLDTRCMIRLSSARPPSSSVDRDDCNKNKTFFKNLATFNTI